MTNPVSFIDNAEEKTARLERDLALAVKRVDELTREIDDRDARRQEAIDAAEEMRAAAQACNGVAARMLDCAAGILWAVEDDRGETSLAMRAHYYREEAKRWRDIARKLRDMTARDDSGIGAESRQTTDASPHEAAGDGAAR